MDTPSIEEAFETFRANNPKIYDLFDRFTWDVIHAGHKVYSSDAIFHRIRWHVDVETVSDDDFKLNDHYTSLYSRLWMKNNPKHKGFFRTRVRTSAEAKPAAAKVDLGKPSKADAEREAREAMTLALRAERFA